MINTSRRTWPDQSPATQMADANLRQKTEQKKMSIHDSFQKNPLLLVSGVLLSQLLREAIFVIVLFQGLHDHWPW